MYTIINSQSPLHSITEGVSIPDSSSTRVITDLTSYPSSTSVTETTIWGTSQSIKPKEMNEEMIRLLIQLSKNQSIFTAVQAVRSLSIILSSGQFSISHSTLHYFLETIKSGPASMTITDSDFLIKQCFYTTKKGYWICPICLHDNCSYLEKCENCTCPHYHSLLSHGSDSDYTYNYLQIAYNKYLLQCLLVLATNPAFCKEMGIREIQFALEQMNHDPYLVVIGCNLMYSPRLYNDT